MKFGKTLQQNQVPEWAAGYVNYKALKKLLAAAASRKKQLGGQALPETDPMRAAFFSALDAELFKVSDFFTTLQQDTMNRCHEISALQRVSGETGRRSPGTSKEAPDDATLVGTPSPQDGQGDDAPPPEHVDDQTLLDEALNLKGELDELVDFQHVNLEGFRKITKKFDKRLKEQSLDRYMATKITPSPLADSENLQAIELSVDRIVKTAHANLENRKANERDWKTYDF